MNCLGSCKLYRMCLTGLKNNERSLKWLSFVCKSSVRQVVTSECCWFSYIYLRIGIFLSLILLRYVSRTYFLFLPLVISLWTTNGKLLILAQQISVALLLDYILPIICKLICRHFRTCWEDGSCWGLWAVLWLWFA